MKRFKDLKIGFRLNLLLSSVFFVVVLAIGIFITNNQKKRIIEDTDTRMYEQLKDLTTFIKGQISENQKEVERIGALAFRIFSNENDLKFSGTTEQINVQNQINQQTYSIQLNSLANQNNSFYKDYSFVDKVKNETGVYSTIFQKIPQGYLRISTNIEQGGVRAINTFIPNSSPVVQSIESGSDYTGRAFVVDDWYLTVYKPLYIDGEVQGMFFVGIPEKDMGAIKKIFADKQYFDSGYPFILAKDGTFIIHPESEGKNITDSEVYKQMNAIKENGQQKIEYLWEGSNKFQYFNSVDEINSWVAVSFYEDELYAIINHTRIIILIALLIGTILFVTVNRIISSNISKSLSQGVKFANDIANGNLTSTLELEQEDEVGQLAKALRTMHERLKDIISNITFGADNIASASQQISSGSQQLSEGATEQASSVEEISSSMEEMASNIEQNNDNSQVTEKIAVEVQTSISDVVNHSQKAVEVNKQVADKIQIINDIAFQTNLLALNAAVEAARAGEQGRGFAVVAAEVRKLAERSKVAAEEIVGLANESYELAELAGKQMLNVLPSIEKTTKLVQEITASSIEQTSGTDQINNAVQQLNNVTQQNAAASEELATSAEELASQADSLKDLISFFRVESEEKKYSFSNRKQQRNIEVEHKSYEGVDILQEE